MRFSSIFRSRWLALLWSAGIIWTAVDLAGSQDPGTEPAANGVSNDGATDLQELQRLVGKLQAS